MLFAPLPPTITSSTHSACAIFADSRASEGWWRAICACASWKCAFRDMEGGGESEMHCWERVMARAKRWSLRRARERLV